MLDTSEPLSDRQQTILNYIVEAHVETAAPVGSRCLEKKYDLGISAATIRNVMNDLEDLYSELEKIFKEHKVLEKDMLAIMVPTAHTPTITRQLIDNTSKIL